jgi:hypothetical protein
MAEVPPELVVGSDDTGHDTLIVTKQQEAGTAADGDHADEGFAIPGGEVGEGWEAHDGGG